jgi:hypothetical protein
VVTRQRTRSSSWGQRDYEIFREDEARQLEEDRRREEEDRRREEEDRRRMEEERRRLEADRLPMYYGYGGGSPVGGERGAECYRTGCRPAAGEGPVWGPAHSRWGLRASGAIFS